MGGLIALLVIFLGYVIVFPLLLGLKIARLSERIQTLEAQLRGRHAPDGTQDAPASPEIHRTLGDALMQGDLPEPLPLEDRPPVQVLTEEAEREEPGEETPPEADGPWSGRPDKGTRAPKQPLMGPAWPAMRDHVSSNWMVWVGGLALGLSVVFLFRYAVDQGWLTPLARVVMGLIFGGLMLSAGEWVRARPVKALERAIKTDFIPPILTGTGVFAVFVSLYAAHALYGLLGPTTGFVALGLTAYSGLALSLRHGALVGLIGLVAGYLVPGLVSAPESAALPLFLYLFVLSAGCLAVMHWRRWWAFAYLTIAGAYLWPALYMLMDFGLADQGILSAYALGLAALFALLATDLPVKVPGTALVRFVATVLTRSSGVGVTGAGLLLLWLADASGYNSAAFVMIGLYGALALGLGAWRDQLEGLVTVAALAALAVVLIWPQPWQVSEPEALQELGRASGGTALWRYVIPAEFTAFFRALLGYGALFGLGAFAGLRWGRSPVIWAGVSAALPVLFFAIGYWRIAAFEVDWNWSVTATLLALSMCAAALVVARRPAPRRDLPLGLYTAATTAALSLAATCLLREAWLTVALAAEILALAWIWSRLPLREIRALTLVLTAIVILRLVANPELLNYEGTVFGSFHWVLYAYGLPALSTWLASRLFRSGGDTLAATMLEITAAGFGFLMVALQLRLWTSGGLKDTEWDLFDLSVQILWWIVAGGLLLRRELQDRHPWTGEVGRWVLGLSIAAVILGSVLALSPLAQAQRVGNWPVVNLLGLAYLLPAALFLFYGASLGFTLPDRYRHTLFGIAGLLVFVDITLETRRAFWGEAMAYGFQTQPGNAEVYAYSVVWIVYAMALLALGILLKGRFLRQASMAVLMLSVAKVFLYDMSDLTGLYRVASFLGLGIVLIGIARIYQRFALDGPAPE